MVVTLLKLMLYVVFTRES